MPKPKNIVLVDEINENWGRETRHAYHAAREIQDQGDTPTTRKVAKDGSAYAEMNLIANCAI